MNADDFDAMAGMLNWAVNIQRLASDDLMADIYPCDLDLCSCREVKGTPLGDYAPLQRRTTDYRGITEELLRMLEYKQADYGADHDPLANIKSSEKWGIPPWVAALIRAGDKMARLQAAARGQQLQNEPAEDSIMDAANYLIIALKLFREEQLAESEVDVSFRPDFGDRPV